MPPRTTDSYVFGAEIDEVGGEIEAESFKVPIVMKFSGLLVKAIKDLYL